jgi:hypothetical protein
MILTDDQDVELGGMEPMPQTRKLLGEHGATLRHFYVNTAVCCPSRSEYLSGRLHHNIRMDFSVNQGQVCGGDGGVKCGRDVDRQPACGCMQINSTTAAFEGTHYGNYMQQAGYTTAYYGKYLNPPAMQIYCCSNASHMPGWDSFQGMCNTAYYNVHWNNEGNLTYTGSTPSECERLSPLSCVFCTRIRALHREVSIALYSLVHVNVTTHCYWDRYHVNRRQPHCRIHQTSCKCVSVQTVSGCRSYTRTACAANTSTVVCNGIS